MSSEFLKLVYGMPADLKRLKMFAKEYGVEIVKEIKQKSLSRNDLVQVHVKLPNGEYGFFTPQGGPKHGYDYQFTRSIAKNYTPDRMKQWADD